MDPRFEWDRDKARENLPKHGVSFEEASTVFREVTIGFSNQGRLVGVVHVDIEADEELTIRIISARLPNRRERNAYEQGE
jgi:uncharacterized DUF497 family protein